ncbi:MAG: hypothetical protein K8S97_02175 [Anaerolineae bacterium]|nr:hypothetical protein [Anaerolineae bacterium]
MKRLVLIALIVVFALSITAAALPGSLSTTAPESGTTLARLPTFDGGETIAPPPVCPHPTIPGC